MNLTKIEMLYDNIPYHIKENIGFPHTYLLLTNEQESFIMSMFEKEVNPIKKELLDCIEEMKGLVDEI
ncbi:MAG: hypothetical protein CMF52_06565 [Legionellales bacterium]|nr:hypothetical protein [Legionellales bacterium]|tara:strand:+ start:3411 stop:3614 length:204 start_codon:yes stop_codon:yes gene_type:complete